MRLPALKPAQVARAFKKAGFIEDRQKGSHLILVNLQTKITLSIPMHAKDIKRGLLDGLIKKSGLTREKFLELT